MPNQIEVSQGLENEKKLNANPQAFVLDSEAQAALNFYIDRLNKARDQRNQANKYFDGMDFVQDYVTNENAKNTYLRPKMNDGEVRVDVGTAEKKIEAIQNELLTMNLQPEVRAFTTDDQEIMELGNDFTDIIKRTNEIEKDEEND